MMVDTSSSASMSLSSSHLDPRAVDHLCMLLTQMADSKSPQMASQSQVALEQFCQQVPDANLYFAAVLTNQAGASTTSIPSRVLAGVLLKNNLKSQVSMGQRAQALNLKSLLLESMMSAQTHHQVQGAIGNILATLVKYMGVKDGSGWTDLPLLLSTNPCKACFSALHMILVDAAGDVVQDLPAQDLAQMIDNLVKGLSASSDSVPSIALDCLIELSVLDFAALESRAPVILSKLLSSNQEQSQQEAGYRRGVCILLRNLLDGFPLTTAPYLQGLLMYELNAVTPISMDDFDDRAVAMEAVDFWHSMIEPGTYDRDEDEHNQEEGTEEADGASDRARSRAMQRQIIPGVNVLTVLQSALPSLLPSLLKNMILSEEDPECLAEEAGIDNPQVPDDTRIARQQRHASHSHGSVQGEEGEIDQGEEGDAGDDEEEDFVWTLRKASAACLDQLAESMPVELFTPVLLPLIQHAFDQGSKNNSSDEEQWKYLELAILALGAVAGGCEEALDQHMPSLMPALVQQLKNPKPLIRSITAWTIGRYRTWLAVLDTEDAHPSHKQLLNMVVQGLIVGVLDEQSKRVQRASSTALRDLADYLNMIPYSRALINTSIQALNSPLYHTKSTLALYDMLSNFCESVDQENALAGEVPECTTLATTLVQKWFTQQSSAEHVLLNVTALFPVIECICSLAVAAGAAFVQVAPACFERALIIIKDCLEASHKALENNSNSNATTSNPLVEDYEDAVDFAIVAIDMIGGLVQGGLGRSIPDNLIPLFNQLLHATLAHSEQDIRQSGFALLGDIAQKCPQVLLLTSDTLTQLMHYISDNLLQRDEQGVNASIANNAAWALGELAPHAKPVEFISARLAELRAILQQAVHHPFDKTYLGNVAVAYGRCLLQVQEPLQTVQSIIAPWAAAMQGVKSVQERRDAMEGVRKAFQGHPLPAILSAVQV